MSSPLDLVWPLLSGPLLVASCIPGATLTLWAVFGVYEGTVRVRFAPNRRGRSPPPGMPLM
jgi:hypothetical protein